MRRISSTVHFMEATAARISRRSGPPSSRVIPKADNLVIAGKVEHFANWPSILLELPPIRA